MSMVYREYGTRLVELQRRIALQLGQVPLVFYNAYGIDRGGLPIDNLDEVAVEGPVQFCAGQDSPNTSLEPFRSEVMYSPKWMEVAVLADGMLRLSVDRRRRFLTGICVREECEGLKTAEIQMESWAHVGRHNAPGRRRLLRAVG